MGRSAALLVASVLSLVLFAAAEAQATIPSCVKLKGTLLLAGESNDDPVLFKQKLLKVRFSEQDILTEFGAPKGSCIRVTPNDAPVADLVQLVGPNGAVLTNLFPFVQVDLATEPGSNIFSGSFNNETSAESSLIIFRISIVLRLDQVQDFELDGVAFEKFKSGAMDDEGDQKVKASIKAKISGIGAFNSDLAFFEGTVALAGKGEFNFQ